MNMPAEKKALHDFCYGLYVLTTHDGNEINGLTASWVSQVSFNPPLIMVALEKSRHTSEMIEHSKVFAINVLRDDQEALAKHFIIPHHKMQNKFESVPHRLGKTGSPILEEASAFVECRVVQQIDPGDHIIYVGELVDAGPMHEGRALCMMDTGLTYNG